MRNTTVVFRGTDQVLDAYEANGMPSWAIVSGNEIMFVHQCTDMTEGKGMLSSMLTKLDQGGSRAIFTLRVYEDPDKINSKTPHDRGFNFHLYDDERGIYSPFDQGRRRGITEAEEQVKKLQQEVDELKLLIADRDDDEEDEPKGVAGMISGIMKMPGVKEALTAKLVGFIHDKILPMNKRPGSVNGVPGQPGEAPAGKKASIMTPEQQQKAQQALNVLCTCDPKLGDHLEKLAKIAVENPSWYNTLAGMLK